MKKIKLPQKYYDTDDSCKLDFLLSLPNDRQALLTITSLIDFRQRHIALELPIEINSDTCMVPLPDNKVFFYGYFYFGMNLNYPRGYQVTFNGITFILEKDFKVEILNEGIPCYGCGGVYYDGNVFIFGGFRAVYKPTNMASIYNLKEKSWKTIANLPVSVRPCSCIEYMGFILIGSHINISAKVFAYDIAGDSYSEIFSEIKGNKIICKYDGYAYIIIPEKKIYESEKNNPFVWKVINQCMIWSYDIVNFQMVFEGFFYFIQLEDGGYHYYRFNLVSKKIDNDNWSKDLKRRL